MDVGDSGVGKGPRRSNLGISETDVVFPVSKRHDSDEILKRLGVPYQINLSSGVLHGFAVRCDLSSRTNGLAKENFWLFSGLRLMI